MKPKKKITEIPISDVRNRSVHYKPVKACTHCGSIWHSIYTCKAYHDVFQNDYELLPKFSKKSNSDKSSNSVLETCSSDKHVKDISATKNKFKNKRIQQVWILKNPN